MERRKKTYSQRSNPRMETVHCPNIVDIEASGFGADSYPIEIGIAKASGERYCALIKPHESWVHWSDSAQALHGITRNILDQRGRLANSICHEINTFLDGEDVFSDAISHDQGWLTKLFELGKCSPTFKLRAIEFIMHEQQYSSWDNTKKHVLLQLNTERHRASSDAFLIQQTFIQTKFKVKILPC